MLPDRVLAATGELDELGEDCDGFTPLHLAAAGGNLLIVKLILQQSGIRGGSTGILVNIHATTWQGLTALDIAKQKNHVELVKRLECFDVNSLELERQKNANSRKAEEREFSECYPGGCCPCGDGCIWVLAATSTGNPYVGSASHNQRHCSGWSHDSSPAPSAGWFFLHLHFCVLLLGGVPCDRNSCLHSIWPRNFFEKGGEALATVSSASITFLFLAIFFLVFSFQLIGLMVFDAVTPPDTVMHTLGYYILLPFPFLNSAYILRYVVLPKGLFRGKTWLLVLFFSWPLLS
ncbi:hypothetical protein M758_7G024200 [Ceratodon purpureus]|nr:hypothetical protein M758_7G024200 [Ceratodon purpureus]